jgi:hypothetical protein
MAPDDKLPRGILLAYGDKIMTEVNKFSAAFDADVANEVRPPVEEEEEAEDQETGET